MTHARWALLLLTACTAHQGSSLTAESWLQQLRSEGPPRSASLRERIAPMEASGAKGDIRDVYRKVAPATVLVRTPHGYGTGIIVDARGYILTNQHVIAGAQVVDGKRKVGIELGALNPQGFMEKKAEPLTAWVLKSDPLVDLAVLGLENPPADLVTVTLSPTDPVPGEPVSAVGHGGIGLMWAIRDGEVASVGRLATHLAQLVGAECQVTKDAAVASACVSSRKQLDTQRAQLADQVPGLVIQSSCQISPGDSGGPLVNRAGELVGVNAFLKSDPSAPVAANFHVHVAEVRKFLEAVPVEPEKVAPAPAQARTAPPPEVAHGPNEGFKPGPKVLAESSGVEGLEHAAVSWVGDDASALLFNLDRAAQATAVEMERRALEGRGVDFIWLRRSATEWFFYDTDGDGTFDVVLFEPLSGEALMGFRGGQRAPELDAGPAVRPSLFKKTDRGTALKALGKVFFNAALLE